MSFSNKVVLITGGSSGIGAAAAIQFTKEGADVAIVGRNEKKLSNVAAECAKIGRQPLVIKADVSKDDEATIIVKKTIDKYEKLDVLINNAGTVRFGSILDGKLLESYDEVMATNLRAVVHITTLATPYLVQTKGNIINVSSIGGSTTPSFPTFISYGMSKAALNYFTRGAALELASSGIRVNTISPGPVRTNILEASGFPGTWDDFQVATALNRVSTPEEIADLMLFLASEKAKGITGSNYVSDNGMLLRSK